MAGHVMKEGMVQAVIVGADRIAANGDTANKIGTYSLAVLAKYHGIPFYVAAPLSTIDPATASGDGIPIEERDKAEVTHFRGQMTARPETPVYNPAFDVTPAGLITAIITEEKVLRPEFGPAIASLRGSGENSLQFLQAAGDLSTPRTQAAGTSPQSRQFCITAGGGDFIQRPAHLGEIAVVGGVHVGPDQGRHIDALRAAAGAAAALAAGMAQGQLHPGVGEEFGLFRGEIQAGGHRPIGLELLEGGIAGDGGGDRFQAQRPLEQGRSARHCPRGIPLGAALL